MLKKLQANLYQIPLLIIFLTSAVLRLHNLGYSDYQGDEIKAFFNPEGYSSTFNFLLDQRKGPGQFFVTFLTEIVNPNYKNEFLTRLPFALAGTFSVIYFYLFLKSFLNNKVSFYAALFFATNGFFVALSRIAQYQPFVMLFTVLALYMVHKATLDESYKHKGIKLGILFWSLSLMFHYDGIFIAPVMLYFLYKWSKQYSVKFELKNKDFIFLRNVAIFNILFLGIFYIPFVINLGQNTLNYWSGRISGDVSAKLSSSIYLFTVYQPIYVIHFYTLFLLLGTFGISVKFAKKVKFLKIVAKSLPEIPFNKEKIYTLILWLVFPLLALEWFIYVPGTHIYTYLMPMFVLMGVGIYYSEQLLNFTRKFIVPEAIVYIYLLLLYVFLFMQSYAIFVDNKEEYPWEEEKFFIWNFPPPTPAYHLSMFGFPYYRNWEGISNAILSSENNGFYSTNERQSIVRFYVPFKKDSKPAGHYIYILNPQSFTKEIGNEKAEYWADRYPPIFTFSKGGKDLVRVYYMEPGSLEAIKLKGF